MSPCRAWNGRKRAMQSYMLLMMPSTLSRCWSIRIMCCCDRGCESARIRGFDERLARGGGGGRDGRDILGEEDEREEEREREK